MEGYLNLKNFEIPEAISRLRLSSQKLAIVTGKQYKIEKKFRLRNLCNLDAIKEVLLKEVPLVPCDAIKDEFHFLLHCDNFPELKNSTFEEIQRSEYIDLSKGNLIFQGKSYFLIFQGIISFITCIGKIHQNFSRSRRKIFETILLIILKKRKVLQFAVDFLGNIIVIFDFFKSCLLNALLQ